MKATALALSLAAALAPTVAPAQDAAPPAAGGKPVYTGEPLPANAPKGEYDLAAWCYGAMSEYVDIYEEVKPDLRAIDKTWGSSQPHEKEPYASDMTAARQEVKVLAGAVTAAEKASPDPISVRGASEVRQGRAIWSVAEQKTHRELARAWLSWALPDKCASNATELTAKSALLGQALNANTGGSATEAVTAQPATPAPGAEPASPQPADPQTSPPTPN